MELPKNINTSQEEVLNIFLKNLDLNSLPEGIKLENIEVFGIGEDLFGIIDKTNSCVLGYINKSGEYIYNISAYRKLKGINKYLSLAGYKEKKTSKTFSLIKENNNDIIDNMSKEYFNAWESAIHYLDRSIVRFALNEEKQELNNFPFDKFVKRGSMKIKEIERLFIKGLIGDKQKNDYIKEIVSFDNKGDSILKKQIFDYKFVLPQESISRDDIRYYEDRGYISRNDKVLYIKLIKQRDSYIQSKKGIIDKIKNKIEDLRDSLD